MTDLYPIGLVLSGRRVLVVGGGTVATRRVPALLGAGALVRLVSPEVTPAIRALADAGRLDWVARRFQPSDLDGAWLVQVAVDERAAAQEVSTAAEQRRVFCVRADDRSAATAWTPAVTRHGPVTVAVLGGGDPRLAMAVRDGIRDWLPSRPVADPPGTPSQVTADPPGTTAVPRVPAVPAPSPPAEEGATAGAEQGAPAGVGQGATTGAEQDATAGAEQESGAGQDPRPGSVALVGAGPGDPELITVRGRRLLAAADVVVADRLAPGLLLDELRADAELIDASKIPRGPAAAQEEINRVLVERARAGRFVVRLKGGDPFVFGRGGEELLACVEAGVPVTVVPGVTSAVAVPAAAGIPVTHRGVAHEFVVVSGHVPPGDPTGLVDWPALARLRGTLCLLMAMANLSAIAAELIRYGRPADTPVAVVQEGTTSTQRVLHSTLDRVTAEVEAAGLRPPAVVVVGQVAAGLAVRSPAPSRAR